MDTALKKQTTPIFTVFPEDTNSIFLRNTASQITCYLKLDHIMLIHH